MSTYVIILKEKKPAKELLLKLREAQTPILNCDLVEPLDTKTDTDSSNLKTSEEIFINSSNFNEVYISLLSFCVFSLILSVFVIEICKTNIIFYALT